MKPLDLTVYPLREKVGRMAEPGYIVNRRAVPEWTVVYRMQDKRFTDAELAAEVWHSITNFYTTAPGEDACEEARRNGIIERFATLPHYDEADR